MLSYAPNTHSLNDVYHIKNSNTMYYHLLSENLNTNYQKNFTNLKQQPKIKNFVKVQKI